MIRGIFFDAADVFYRRDESTTAYARRLLAGGGYATQIAPEAADRLEELHLQASRGVIGHEEFWHAFLQAHGVPVGEDRVALVQQIGAQTMVVQPIPGARESVGRLKARGFLIGIVTDTIYPLTWKMNWLEQAGVADFVDVITCSSESGLKKPDPAIYLDAVRKAGLSPAESRLCGSRRRRAGRRPAGRPDHRGRALRAGRPGRLLCGDTDGPGGRAGLPAGGVGLRCAEPWPTSLSALPQEDGSVAWRDLLALGAAVCYN